MKSSRDCWDRKRGVSSAGYEDFVLTVAKLWYACHEVVWKVSSLIDQYLLVGLLAGLTCDNSPQPNWWIRSSV